MRNTMHKKIPKIWSGCWVSEAKISKEWQTDTSVQKQWSMAKWRRISKSWKYFQPFPAKWRSISKSRKYFQSCPDKQRRILKSWKCFQSCPAKLRRISSIWKICRFGPRTVFLIESREYYQKLVCLRFLIWTCCLWRYLAFSFFGHNYKPFELISIY